MSVRVPPLLYALPLRTVIPVLTAYVVLSALGLHYHELGLEEGQQYLFGRDSASIADLYHNMRYEGHPRLWCILLYGIIHHITTDFIAIQGLHLLISSSTVYLFLRYAPIDRFLKIGLVFGYYFLFEYNIQSRSYALGILLLFITCHLMSQPSKNRARAAGSGAAEGQTLAVRPDGTILPRSPFRALTVGSLLFLLCNTDIFFAFAAIGIFLYLTIEYAAQHRLWTVPFYLLTALFLAGLACTYIQAQIPREDYIVYSRLGNRSAHQYLSSAYLTLAGGWLPIPGNKEHFWNTFLAGSDHLGGIFKIALSLFFLLLPGVVLKNHPRALVFYYSSVLLLLVLLMVSGFGAARYYGMVVIYFLAAWWLAGSAATADFAQSPALRLTLGAIVLLQLGVGFFAWEQEITRPFSQAKNAVAWLKNRRLDEQAIVVDGYIAGPALSTYLGKKCWYLNTGGEGSFCLWRRPYFPIPPKTMTEEMAGSTFLPRLDSFLLLSNKAADLQGQSAGDFRFVPLQSFTDGILTNEDCYIYQATRKANH